MKSKQKKPSSSQKGTEVWFEGEDGSDMDDNIQITSANMIHYFRVLCEKKRASREEALFFIVEALTKKPGGFNKFLDKNFLMLLCHCLDVIREGSTDEVQLASSVIGLLAMIVASQSRIREVYEESIPVFSVALESKSKAWNVVDSLAIMAFFAAENSHEAEQVMKMIWNLIDPEPTPTAFSSGHPPSVVATAVSAWSFLLSSIEGWRLGCKYWQGVIPCLLSLLNTNDEAVAIAASEALELVCGFDCVGKFSTEASSINVQELKGKTLKHLGGKPKKEKLDVFMGHQKITLSAWSQVLQLNFIERFLGEEGLTKHMMENKNFHRIFNFTLQRRDHGAKTLYSPEREEATVSFFLPDLPALDDDTLSAFTATNADRQLLKNEAEPLYSVMSSDIKLCTCFHISSCIQRMTKAQCSSFSKAKTKLRSKQRAFSKERDLFAIMDQDQGPSC